MRKGPRLTNEQEALAIELATRGESLSTIIKELCVSESAFQAHRREDPIFADKFHAARQDGIELIADSLMNVANEFADVQRGRLHSDNIRWLLSKRKPDTYGERIDLNVNQTIDISGALKEAKQRALNASNILDITPLTNVQNSDKVKAESES